MYSVENRLRGYLTYWQGDAGRAIPLFRRALDHLDPVAHSLSYAQSLHLLAQAYGNCGQRERALDLLRKGLAEATAFHRPERVILLGSRVLLYLYAGELAEVTGAAERLLSLVEAPPADLLPAAGTPPGTVRIWHGWAHYWMGAVCYEQNDLESAALHWRQVEAMRYRANLGAFCDSLIGLALIAQAQGAVVQALAYAQAAREFAIEVHSPSLLGLSAALKVRLALSGGLRAEALQHASEIDTTTKHGNAVWLEPASLAVVRALLAEATPASLVAARQLAETCLRQAENAHNTRQTIQAAALQALVWRAQRRTPEALGALDRALALAEPRGFVRTFLDLGAPMAELLQHCERRSSPYVGRLLATFARELNPAGRDESATRYGQLYDITPLTRRELELLDLIAQRLTYREIAERLVISYNTVKTHVGNVYSKLGVSNRRQAVAKAEQVGLLAPA